MRFEIKSRFGRAVLFSLETESLRLNVHAAEYNAAVGLIECHAKHWTPAVGSDSVPAAGTDQK